jgi:hypothetical protein
MEKCPLLAIPAILGRRLKFRLGWIVQSLRSPSKRLLLRLLAILGGE